MNNVWILAQANGDDTIIPEPVSSDDTTSTLEQSDTNGTEDQPQGRGPWGSKGSLIFIALMFVMMYLILFRGPRKKQQQHKQMVQTLSKNDRVRTIGGIIGTVVDIKDNEITLKIDESNNTKIKVIPSAIGRNVSKDKD